MSSFGLSQIGRHVATAKSLDQFFRDQDRNLLALMSEVRK